jgi:hypothetical protein
MFKILCSIPSTAKTKQMKRKEVRNLEGRKKGRERGKEGGREGGQPWKQPSCPSVGRKSLGQFIRENDKMM